MPAQLNIIIGSTRPGRSGPTVAKWVDQVARENQQFQVQLVDLADFKLPLLDEPAHPRLRQYTHAHTKAWSASVEPADAFLFVTPEYDYFPPASLVNAVQTLALEWAHKPAGVVSYGGISGGLRSTQVLRQLLSNMNMHALPQTVPIPMFTQHIKDGQFHATEPMTKGLNELLAELAKWTEALRPMRAG